ncbi:MAG: PQQ-binding-like beta-propeller repeat protein, partial [Verrucomicrobia bacterium]|nr:PQQ-binding-like beta-propeller repeat protein [Verrucomicrobiota bacterium]
VVAIRKGHTALCKAVAMAADGKTFATASADQTIIQWDAATFEILARRRGHLAEVESLAISADGRMMVSGSVDKATKIWTADLRHASTMLDGPSLVAGFIEGGRKLVSFMTNSLCVWETETGGRVDFPVPPSTPLLLADIWGIPYAVKPDEPLCVRGREDGTVEVLSLANGTEAAHWSAHTSGICAIVFSSDGKRLATGSKTGEVKIWEFATRRELARLGPVRGQANCLAFSPDGRALAAVANSTRVWLWDMNTGQEIKLDGQDIEAYAVAFSPDGKLLAATTGTSNEVHLWELPSGRHVAVLKSHVMGINSVAFSPDGKTLATGSTDRRVKLWNVATRQEVATLSPGITAPMVSFSPDGRILAIGDLSSAGRQIQVLRAPSFEDIAQKEQAGKWKGEGEP